MSPSCFSCIRSGAFQLPLDMITIIDCGTDKTANAPETGGSQNADTHGKAVKVRSQAGVDLTSEAAVCCEKLLEVLEPVLKEEPDWKKAIIKAYARKLKLQASEHITSQWLDGLYANHREGNVELNEGISEVNLISQHIYEKRGIEYSRKTHNLDGFACLHRIKCPVLNMRHGAYSFILWLSSIEREKYGIPEDSPTYQTSGVACVMSELDCRTGEQKLLSVDVVLDVGRSLNPAIDIGQIEGAFMQGYGLMTSEELTYDDNGKLIQDSMYKYKIPTPATVPRRFRVKLLKDSDTFVEQVYSSKGIGEPPLMLSVTALASLRYAINARRRDLGFSDFIELSAPLTTAKIISFCNP
ncbi:unnamed protein product [Cylicostephanus goldi]|uniref:Aldehyde oxidase/xanthine dehydrogenase second molybdopterin binding domain-containing protein n=1 Tax=Cylicostephanus goldi TaxID=71465 RepID=A0A3P6RXE5_CYLGO|nr:unnamed protein product [Cylicostephanus goldi]